MKRPINEIIIGFRCVSKKEEVSILCKECPYKKEKDCVDAVNVDVLKILHKYEKEHPDKIPESWKKSVMQSFMKGE